MTGIKITHSRLVARGELKRCIFLIAFMVICQLYLLFLSAAPVPAEDKNRGDPQYIFYKGNTLYEQGKYDLAIREYSKLPARGMESGNLYYNLGNSFFKKGDLGKAILNYERAKRLIPRDSDLKSNYNFALSRIKYNAPETSASLLKRVTGIFNILSINEMTLLLSAVFVSAVFFFIARLYIQVTRRFSVFFMSVLIIVFILISFSLFNRISMLDKEAIVISESTEAGFEPFENATAHFTLYEGMKVYIVESKKGWRKVERFDGKSGWVRNQDIGKI